MMEKTTPTKCVCDSPGYCELMQRDMHSARWNECKNVPHYFEMFLKEAGTYKPATASASRPCIHRGEENGRIECPSCSGMVKVKTFDCVVHGSCTLGKRVDDVTCCVGCGDYLLAAGQDLR